MTDLLEALRSAFDAEPLPPSVPTTGTRHVTAAERALKDANGQLTILKRADAFTPSHAKALAAASASLRAAAFALEQLSAGVEEHLSQGFSVWTGDPGAEKPVLL